MENENIVSNSDKRSQKDLVKEILEKLSCDEISSVREAAKINLVKRN